MSATPNDRWMLEPLEQETTVTNFLNVTAENNPYSPGNSYDFHLVFRITGGTWSANVRRGHNERSLLKTWYPMNNFNHNNGATAIVENGRVLGLVVNESVGISAFLMWKKPAHVDFNDLENQQFVCIYAPALWRRTYVNCERFRAVIDGGFEVAMICRGQMDVLSMFTQEEGERRAKSDTPFSMRVKLSLSEHGKGEERTGPRATICDWEEPDGDDKDEDMTPSSVKRARYS